MSPRSSGANRTKPADQVGELRDLVVGYAKQETLDPLKNLKRYLSRGIAGAACLGVGLVFLLLALLRGLQSIDVFAQDGVEPGASTLVPYAITLLAGFVVVAWFVGMIKRDAAKLRAHREGVRR